MDVMSNRLAALGVAHRVLHKRIAPFARMAAAAAAATTSSATLSTAASTASFVGHNVWPNDVDDGFDGGGDDATGNTLLKVYDVERAADAAFQADTWQNNGMAFEVNTFTMRNVHARVCVKSD